MIPAAAMATSRQPATAAKRRRPQEQQRQPNDSSDICAYWSTSPAFDHQKVLIRRLFFINSDRTNYMCVDFYPARNYQPLVEFCVIRRGGSISILLTDEYIDTLTDCLPTMLVSICNGDRAGIVFGCE